MHVRREQNIFKNWEKITTSIFNEIIFNNDANDIFAQTETEIVYYQQSLSKRIFKDIFQGQKKKNDRSEKKDMKECGFRIVQFIVIEMEVSVSIELGLSVNLQLNIRKWRHWYLRDPCKSWHRNLLAECCLTIDTNLTFAHLSIFNCYFYFTFWRVIFWANSRFGSLSITNLDRKRTLTCLLSIRSEICRI